MSLNGASLVPVLVDFPSPSVNVLTTLALILSKNLFCIQPLKNSLSKHILAQILCPGGLDRDTFI